MTRFRKSSMGYVDVNEKEYSYSLLEHVVYLLPAYSNSEDRENALECLCSKDNDLPYFIYGHDENYTQIAFFNTSKLNRGKTGLSPVLHFVSPLVVKAKGNTFSFYNKLTDEWNKYHAITFVGGNINSIFNPQSALAKNKCTDFGQNGVREIQFRPVTEYSKEATFRFEEEICTISFSIQRSENRRTTEDNTGYILGELNSIIRLSFEKAQDFDQIIKHYRLIKSLVSLLVVQNNITFDVYLSQRNDKGQYFPTADCKVLRNYDNYSSRKCHQVVSAYRIFDYIPVLLEQIANNEFDPIFDILPDDNAKVSYFSIEDIQKICTALENVYNWRTHSRNKDVLIKKLKEEITKTIKAFCETHKELDVANETNISSCFQYLTITLRKRILELYTENKAFVDHVVKKWQLPEVNEESIRSFVGLRNKKTHSGISVINEKSRIYLALLAMIYACILRRIGLSDDMIMNEIHWAF